MKVKYHLFLAVAALALLCIAPPLSAQIYSKVHGISGTQPNNVAGNASNNPCGGGYQMASSGMTEIRVSSRGAVLFTATEEYKNYISVVTGEVRVYDGTKGNTINCHYDSYRDRSATHVADVYAGEVLTIETGVGSDHARWANAALFIDWDGNGVFDDHDPYLYNKYDVLSAADCEFALNKPSDDKSTWLQAAWDIPVPATYTAEQTVRVRVKHDVRVKDEVDTRYNVLCGWTANGWPKELNNWWCDQANEKSSLGKVGAYTMDLHRFEPSSEVTKGSAFDFTMHIMPRPNAVRDLTTTPNKVQIGTGSILDCEAQPTTGTAIANATDFTNFLNNPTTGDYYLTADITVSDASISQKDFYGTLDGRGHKITFTGTQTCSPTEQVTDERAFMPTAKDKIMAQLIDMQQWSDAPDKVMAGFICRRLYGTVKNLNLSFEGDRTVSTGATSAIVGLVTGINKGRIENVTLSVASLKTVKLETSAATSAFAGFAGINLRGVIKNCVLDLNGNLTAPSVGNYSTVGGFIGRYQSGVVGNVMLKGNGKLEIKKADANTYIGGIAGITKTFLDGFTEGWGYDNGTVGLEVSNIVLNYQGNINFTGNGTGNVRRGVLFGECADGVTVPNLISALQGNLTIRSDVTTAEQNASSLGLTSNTDGKLYLYRNPIYYPDKDLCAKYTKVTLKGSDKLEFAREYDPQSCTVLSTKIVVKTETAGILGITGNQSNVVYGGTDKEGKHFVEILADPANHDNATWQWSTNPVTPPAAGVTQVVCGDVCAPLLTTYCSTLGRNSKKEYDRGVDNVQLKGRTIAVGETSSDAQDTYRGKKNGETSAIGVAKGETFTFKVNGNMNWTFVSCFADWNHDGTFEYINKMPSAEASFNNDDTGRSAYRMFSIKVPDDAEVSYTPLRVVMEYANNFQSNPCQLTDVSNQSLSFDIILKVGTTASPSYCSQPTTYNNVTADTGRGNWSTGHLSDLTATSNGVATEIAKDWTAGNGGTITGIGDRNVVGSSITVKAGHSLELGFKIKCGWTGTGDDKGLNWTCAFAFVDKNGDGTFSNDERILAKGGGGSSGNATMLPDGASGSETEWSITKTVTFDAGVRNSLLRVFTIGELNDGFKASAESMAAYNSGCATGSFAGCGGTNKFHCYDFPIVINVDGVGCRYAHNFGNVFIGESKTYQIVLEAGKTADNIQVTAPYSATFDAASSTVTITYTPTAAGDNNVTGAVTFQVDGQDRSVDLNGRGVDAPNVTFTVGADGGGHLSKDLGATTALSYSFTDYKGEKISAVKRGPVSLEGWYVSTDNGGTWQKDATTPVPTDYIYKGTADATVEARFSFEAYAGNFGNSRFTDNTTLPFYISNVTSTEGMIDLNTEVFKAADVNGGSAHYKDLTAAARLQTVPAAKEAKTHHITVTMKNMTQFRADARLLCLVDINSNGYFDFTSSPTGAAKDLTANGELVYVGAKNGTDDTQTFEFDITNTGLDAGKTRIRLMATSYVDMYGLGPVNHYGNYEPRLDTDGDGREDASISMCDTNGDFIAPNNACNYSKFVNVADVTLEATMYIGAKDTLVIRDGEAVRLGDLFIESVEDATGIHSGVITFDNSSPSGSLQVDGNIIIRKRIYQDQWHAVAFPFEVQGTTGPDGIRAVDAQGNTHQLSDNMWLLKGFDPVLRNQDNGYGNDFTNVAKTSLAANTFYEFAADNDGGAILGDENGMNYYWIQFYSTQEGIRISPTSATTITIPFVRRESSSQYWNRNVYTLYNPYLSPINVQEITTSPTVGWENITWWNASQKRFVPVSAAENRPIPPFYGFWIQFTQGIGTANAIEVVLGDVNRVGYSSPEERVTWRTNAVGGTPKASTFDVPDSYTIGLDAVATAGEKYPRSSTIVTLTNAGAIDEFRAGYDMPHSHAPAKTVAEIWSKAGASRMMFNDVERTDYVVVPLGIRIVEAGEYVIRLSHTNKEASLVQLHDLQTGALVELQNGGSTFSYAFLAEAGDADRFELIIQEPKMLTAIDAIEGDAAGTAVYTVGDKLCVRGATEGGAVAVCDVLGREVMRSAVQAADFQIDLPYAGGVYLVKLTDAAGKVQQVVKLTR